MPKVDNDTPFNYAARPEHLGSDPKEYSISDVLTTTSLRIATFGSRFG